MNKEGESRPSLVETVVITCLIALFVKIALWDRYSPSFETHGSQRLIGERFDWQFATGLEDSIIKIAPWIDDDQLWRTSVGSLKITGRLIVDERLDIRDRIIIQSALK